MKRLCAITILLAVVSAGCGTMLNGTNQTMRVRTDSPGMTVEVSPIGMVYDLPANISLPRKGMYVFTFKAEGYEDKKVLIRRKVSGGIVFLNILSGFVPVIIDAVTGGWYNLTSEPEFFTLTKEPGARESLPDMLPIHVKAISGHSKAEMRLEASEPLQKETP